MAKKGTIITCLVCKKDVLELRHDIEVGQVATAKDFKGVGGYDNPKDGDEAVCPNCKAGLIPSVMAVL